jgi:hypothetical protein
MFASDKYSIHKSKLDKNPDEMFYLFYLMNISKLIDIITVKRQNISDMYRIILNNIKEYIDLYIDKNVDTVNKPILLYANVATLCQDNDHSLLIDEYILNHI